MALKSNFEATSDIASPFVDEIANPGGIIDQKPRTTEKQVVAATVASGRKFLSNAQKAIIRLMDTQIHRAEKRQGKNATQINQAVRKHHGS